MSTNTPHKPTADDELDEALQETFPASDPVEPTEKREKLPPADKPGSDVHND